MILVVYKSIFALARSAGRLDAFPPVLRVLLISVRHAAPGFNNDGAVKSDMVSSARRWCLKRERRL